MLNGEVRAADVIELALRALPRETDELVAQRILGYLNQAYWRFSPASRRAALAARVETSLRTGLDAAQTTSLKGAYFSTLRDVALTGQTLAWLERVWRQEEKVPGLVLAENDDIALAQELAVRAVPGWQAILQQQIDRTKNPDRKARLQFPTGSAASSSRRRTTCSAPRRRREWPGISGAPRVLLVLPGTVRGPADFLGPTGLLGIE